MTKSKAPLPHLVNDSLPERNNHLSHCRARVAEWSMRDVLDYLMAHYAVISVYLDDADTEEMARVDAANREKAARYMAGY